MASLPHQRPSFTIPAHELEYTVSRAGGPGGQHVNKSSTRVEVWWDVATTPSLSDEQRSRLLTKLAARLDTKGRLRVVSGGSRSQLQNRKDVTQRLERMVNTALIVPKPRKKTKPGRAARERRLADKKAQTAKKARRKPPVDE